MVTVAFLGAVARLNAELGTGATAKDIHRAALEPGTRGAAKTWSAG